MLNKDLFGPISYVEILQSNRDKTSLLNFIFNLKIPNQYKLSMAILAGDELFIKKIFTDDMTELSKKSLIGSPCLFSSDPEILRLFFTEWDVSIINSLCCEAHRDQEARLKFKAICHNITKNNEFPNFTPIELALAINNKSIIEILLSNGGEIFSWSRNSWKISKNLEGFIRENFFKGRSMRLDDYCYSLVKSNAPEDKIYYAIRYMTMKNFSTFISMLSGISDWRVRFQVDIRKFPIDEGYDEEAEKYFSELSKKIHPYEFLFSVAIYGNLQLSKKYSSRETYPQGFSKAIIEKLKKESKSFGLAFSP